MAFKDGYLSEFVGRPAVLQADPERRTLGKVVDFYVRKPDDTFPRIDGLVVRTPEGERCCAVRDVIDVDEKGAIVLRTAPSEPCVPDDLALYLIKDLFDKQIVDVNGRKVVRINDLEVANTGGTLRVVAADVGVGGLLRRLGVGRIAPHLLDRVPRSLIAWDNVSPITDVNPSQVQLSVAGSRLSRLHPSELADIITELSAQDAARVVKSLDDETAADAFEHLDADVQQSIIADLGADRAADIIEEMDSDDAADLLGELDAEKRAELLREECPADAGLRDEVESLLAQQADSFLESGPVSAIKTLTSGARLGNFEIMELIGRGGMGEVYRARDARLKRDVALKILPADLANDRSRRQCFKLEARAVAALNHPNIVAI